METRHMVTSSLMFPAFEQANHDVTGQAITMNQTQPWSLYTVIEYLQDTHWCGEILSCLHQHFPNSRAFTEPELEWSEALNWLLTEMDQQWFPINWELVEEYCNWSQHDPSMMSELMSCLWRALPIKQYGIRLREDVEIDNIWFESPALCLILMLLEPNFLCTGFIENDFPYDFIDLDYFNKGEWLFNEATHYHQQFFGEPLDFWWLMEPLLQTAEGLRLAKYLRDPLGVWLPVVVKIARAGYGGNIFTRPFVDLDHYNHPVSYHWDFVEEFRQQWQVAKPVIDSLKEFDDWIMGSPDKAIQTIAEAQWGLSSISNLALFTHILEKGKTERWPQ